MLSADSKDPAPAVHARLLIVACQDFAHGMSAARSRKEPTSIPKSQQGVVSPTRGRGVPHHTGLAYFYFLSFLSSHCARVPTRGCTGGLLSLSPSPTPTSCGAACLRSLIARMVQPSLTGTSKTSAFSYLVRTLLKQLASRGKRGKTADRYCLLDEIGSISTVTSRRMYNSGSRQYRKKGG